MLVCCLVGAASPFPCFHFPFFSLIFHSDSKPSLSRIRKSEIRMQCDKMKCFRNPLLVSSLKRNAPALIIGIPNDVKGVADQIQRGMGDA